MYAVVREVIYTPGRELSDQEYEESEAEMMSVPGHVGQLTVDIGGGTLLCIRVWETEEMRTAAKDHQAIKRQHEAHKARMSLPMIGCGTVVSNTLVKP